MPWVQLSRCIQEHITNEYNTDIWDLERRACSLIKNYPKGLSPAMKQVILLLPLSHPSTLCNPPPPHHHHNHQRPFCLALKDVSTNHESKSWFRNWIESGNRQRGNKLSHGTIILDFWGDASNNDMQKMLKSMSHRGVSILRRIVNQQNDLFIDNIVSACWAS